MTLDITITGTEADLRLWALQNGKHVAEVAVAARKAIKRSKAEVAEWQAMCLYALGTHLDWAARKADRVGYALEIGTALGYTAYFIAKGMPHTFITTLNPNDRERAMANTALKPLVVECLGAKSWDYIKKSRRAFDLVFVDGDHARVSFDLPWFNRLATNGLILFHDYSPAGSARPCVPVWEAVNKMAEALSRMPDVLLMDEGQVGMAGFYRREGELWHDSIRDGC